MYLLRGGVGGSEERGPGTARRRPVSAGSRGEWWQQVVRVLGERAGGDRAVSAGREGGGDGAQQAITKQNSQKSWEEPQATGMGKESRQAGL